MISSYSITDPSPEFQSALAAIHTATDPYSPKVRAYRIRRITSARAGRRAKVNRFMVETGCWPLLEWLSEPTGYVRGFMSTDEARAWLRREIARIRSLNAGGHWAYGCNAHRLPGLRDRLIVATYFARFGAEIWAREAA